MNKVERRTMWHVIRHTTVPYDDDDDDNDVDEIFPPSFGFPVRTRGYQPAHKTALTLPPYAGRPAVYSYERERAILAVEENYFDDRPNSWLKKYMYFFLLTKQN